MLDPFSSSDVNLKADERLEDLQNQGYRILQKKSGFRYGTDAVLLSDFVRLRKRDHVMDLGTGTGIIAILLAVHHPEILIDAVEIQPEMADMAIRSVLLNGLSGRVTIANMDLRRSPECFGISAFDAVVCNPPYFREGSALLPHDENRRISRVESETGICEICQCAKRLLKSGGRFSAIYPAQRMLEMMNAMEQERLMPKRVRTVHAKANRAPRFVLLDAVKDGGSQLDWLPPLVLENADGTPTEEWNRIYGKE